MKQGLTFKELAMLTFLTTNSPAKISELASGLRMTLGSVRELAYRMTKMGYVTRNTYYGKMHFTISEQGIKERERLLNALAGIAKFKGEHP